MFGYTDFIVEASEEYFETSFFEWRSLSEFDYGLSL